MAAPLHVIGVSSPRSYLGSRRQRNATLIDGLLVRAFPLGLGQGPADTLRQPGHGEHSIFVTWLEFRARKSVVEGKRVSVSVDPGVRLIIKKKTKKKKK